MKRSGFLVAGIAVVAWLFAVQYAVGGDAVTKHAKGTFEVSQHDGLMDRGKPSLTITVVPDSGTGELSGIAGTMTIEITGGKHFYELMYTLTAKP